MIVNRVKRMDRTDLMKMKNSIPVLRYDGTLLDSYLEKGWYRFGGRMNTTDVLKEGEHEFPLFWLRYDVPKVRLNRKVKALLNKHSAFTVSYKPFRNTEELEELHTLYRNSIDFETESTLYKMLGEDQLYSFDSFLVEVRDGSKLIAAGIFDKGENCIQGIKNIYHPDYKQQYSLGKLLVILKYKFCFANNIAWYYPGYFSPDPACHRFNYKLFLDKEATQVYNREENRWSGLSEVFNLSAFRSQAKEKIPFKVINWSKISHEVKKGETGTAFWQTQQFGGVRVRIMEYSAGYLADHWCRKGHIVHCLEGSFTTELQSGETFKLTKGMSYVVSDELSSHRSRCENGVKLLIVDGDFLAYEP
jgi:leucyl-tRNA---protein transferase